MGEVEEVTLSDLFSLSEDESLQVKAGALQRFLRLEMMGYQNPALALVRGEPDKTATQDDPEVFCDILWTRDDIAEHWTLAEPLVRGEAATEAYIDAVIDAIGDRLQDISIERGSEVISQAMPDLEEFMEGFARGCAEGVSLSEEAKGSRSASAELAGGKSADVPVIGGQTR